MKKAALSISVGFIINNVVATLVALFILNPLLNPSFNSTVRTEAQGLEIPSLLGGYLLLTLIMVWVYPKVRWKENWFKKGLVFGVVIGGMVFVSGHLIVAGWSVIPPMPMLISGLLDSLSTICTGVFIAYIYRDE